VVAIVLIRQHRRARRKTGSPSRTPFSRSTIRPDQRARDSERVDRTSAHQRLYQALPSGLVSIADDEFHGHARIPRIARWASCVPRGPEHGRTEISAGSVGVCSRGLVARDHFPHTTG
jgi:hypothetical protein